MSNQAEVERRIANAHKGKLPELDLSGIGLTAIPDAVFHLSQLQWLSLANNQIAQIPDSLARLSQLQRLYLGDNQIAQIRDSLARLSQLQVLYLHNNQIARLPDSLARLLQLQGLYLHNNQIAQIPDSLARLSRLQWLSLDNNPLDPEARERYQSGGWEALRAYLLERARGTERSWRAKLLSWEKAPSERRIFSGASEERNSSRGSIPLTIWRSRTFRFRTRRSRTSR